MEYGYAIRKDGQGHRAVAGPGDVGPDEVYGDTPPPVVTQPSLKDQARMALDASDVTMLRCVEAGITAPVAWNVYRKALRSIVNGADTTSTALPTRPAYPAGT